MGISLSADEQSALRRDASIYAAEGGDLSQDLIDLQSQIDTGAVAGSVTAAMLHSNLADLFATISWGTPDAEDANTIDVRLQLLDVQGNSLAAERVFELRVSDAEYGAASASATIAAGDLGLGTIISGSGTATVLVETDADGKLDLKISEAAAASRYIVASPSFGSPFLDCTDSLTLPFA